MRTKTKTNFFLTRLKNLIYFTQKKKSQNIYIEQEVFI